MIKKILIEYVKSNDKYYSYIDEECTGKWYDIESCLKGVTERIELMKKREKENGSND